MPTEEDIAIMIDDQNLNNRYSQKRSSIDRSSRVERASQKREEDGRSLQISKIKPFGKLETQSQDQKLSAMRKASQTAMSQYASMKNSGVSSPTYKEEIKSRCSK